MKNRIASLDLLRILSISLIVSFHASYKGIPASIVDDIGRLNQSLYYLFYHFGELGVNLFMLVTGFFLINSKQIKRSKIINFIIDVYFFTFLSITFASFMGKYNFHIQDLFPVNFCTYWYITGYLIIYILSPFINKFVASLSKKKFQKFLVILFIIFSVVPTLSGLIYGTTENLGFYNRFIWLFFMYLVGGYLSLYRNKLSIMNTSIKKLLPAFLGIVIFTSIFALFMHYAKIDTVSFDIPPTYFWGPNSIIMFFISVLLFAIFYHIKISDNKILSAISASTLSIYLLHEHPASLYILWFDIFSLDSFHHSRKLFAVILIATITIIIVGTLIHYLKKYTFDKLINHVLVNTDGEKR